MVLEGVDLLDDRLDRLDLGAQVAGGAELLDEALRGIEVLLAKLERLGAFRRDDELHVLAQLLLGRFPPALVLALGDDVAFQHLLELVEGEATAAAGEDELDEGDGVRAGERLQIVGSGEAPGEEGALGDGDEGEGGELHAQLVALLAFEIDDDLDAEAVPVGDPAHAPALVVA